MILCLDPSSTRCGYALMSAPAHLHEAGLLQPKPRKLTLLPRVRQFAADVAALVSEFKPTAIVIEVSTTCHGSARSAGYTATLGVYGLAVGYLLRTIETLGPAIDTVEATIWTERVPKDRRTATIARLYPGRYHAESDPGGDAADAIGIGRWWLFRHREGVAA